MKKEMETEKIIDGGMNGGMKKKSKVVPIVVGVILVVAIVGGFMFNRYSKTQGYINMKAEREKAALLSEGCAGHSGYFP